MTEGWRYRIVQEALTWDRTPYHHQGRIKMVGVDCAMLPAEVYKSTGHIPHIETPDYPMDWHMHKEEERYKGWVERFATALPEGELPLPGDLVLYKFARCFSHGAIVLEWPRVIHAVRRAGKVVIDDFGDQGEWDRARLYYTFDRSSK